MQVVFQDPYGSLSPRLSIWQIIEEGLEDPESQLDNDERRVRVVKALAEVGLDPERDDRYPQSSPAVNASESRSPAPWCSSRNS